MTGPGKSSSNYTFMLSVERTGPTIVTASINPNPCTPGAEFNITAYVIDSTPSAFNPAAGIGNVTVTPQGPNYITNIVKTTHMNASLYQGVFVLSGKVNSSANYTSFEIFKVTATDSGNNSAIYIVELFLNYFLNPNQYYPSNYLGPTSMVYNNFAWNASGSSIYYNGYNVSAYDVSNGGVYFHLQAENHNTSETIYINGLSNIYFLFTYVSSGQSDKLLTVSSFMENKSSFLAEGSTGYIKLPSNTPVNLTFGYDSLGNTVPDPGTVGAFKTVKSGSNLLPTEGTISLDFLIFSGYEISSTGQYISYGQTLPFTAIYWT